ncbi:MAG TPA: hypothetical protein VMW15_16385 [Terracidiphilus sp.]|nr:hypothetical protein [Terracidiphilus sp.]
MRVRLNQSRQQRVIEQIAIGTLLAWIQQILRWRVFAGVENLTRVIYDMRIAQGLCADAIE